MHTSLVEHLVCPDTGAPLRLECHKEEDGQVVEGELISCLDIARRYPIRSGVPRFVDPRALEGATRETVEAFDYKWSTIPAYAHEQATKANRERWYCERFGFPRGDEDIRQFLHSARFVLEAGTGTGVDTDLLTRNCDGQVFGIDISSAIDVARSRFRGRERVSLLQADIGRLPFPEGLFDVISCDQVLHHTSDPPRNFKRLVRLLRSGGRLLLYVYRVKGPLREFADDYLRGRLSRSPLETCLEFSDKITALGRSLSRLRATIKIDRDIPELEVKQGSYDLHRFLYDHVLKCFWNDDYDFKTNMMINFDWYRPAYAFRYTEDDIRTWAKEEHMAIEHWHVSPSGISAIMRKP